MFIHVTKDLITDQIGVQISKKDLLFVKRRIEEILQNDEEFFENCEQVRVAKFGQCNLSEFKWTYPVCAEALQIQHERFSRKVDRSMFIPRKPKKTFIYLMRDNATSHIKIGVSKDPAYRERTLLSCVPKIELLFSCWNDAIVEKELHAHFAHLRLRGEWFNLNNEQIEEAKQFITNYETTIPTTEAKAKEAHPTGAVYQTAAKAP